MEPVPSLKIIKYVLYDQFLYKKKQQERFTEQALLKDLTPFMNGFDFLSMEQNLFETTWTVFDLETTGFFPNLGDEIVSIGAIKLNVSEMKFEEHFYEVVSPICEVPNYIFDLTGLDEQQVRSGKLFPEAFLKFLQFSQNTILVAHPASFDVHFLQVMAKRWGLPKYKPLYLDSYFLANFLRPKQNNKLDPLVSYFGIEQKERHHALNDAQMTAEVFKKLLGMLQQKEIHTFEDLAKIKGNKKGRWKVKRRG